MANIQPTYTQAIPLGYPGMIANGEPSNRISRTVEDVAGIPFGRAAFRGVGEHGCTATPNAATFMGITIEDPTVVSLAGVAPGGVAADIYPQYATAGLLSRGEICVTAGVTVTAGQDVYVTAAGVFTNASSGNTLLPAKFDTNAASGGILWLRVRHAA